jgi:hypothetical protein
MSKMIGSTQDCSFNTDAQGDHIFTVGLDEDGYFGNNMEFMMNSKYMLKDSTDPQYTANLISKTWFKVERNNYNVASHYLNDIESINLNDYLNVTGKANCVTGLNIDFSFRASTRCGNLRTTLELISVFDSTSLAVIHRPEDVATFNKDTEEWLANNYLGADEIFTLPASLIDPFTDQTLNLEVTTTNCFGERG